ncbi:MAG: HDIG domain-containing protein [Halanaerobiales bacterium]|nr:HDIG domain-containing protein [Halanaerobiales bacterium]
MQIWNRSKKWFNDLYNFEFKVNNIFKKRLSFIIFFIIIAVILSFNFFPNQIDLEVGQVSRTDIVAPRAVTFVDQTKTEQLREIAVESASKVYEEDKSINRKILNNINNIFNTILNTKTEIINLNGSQFNNQVLNEIKSNNNLNVSISDLSLLIRADLSKIEALRDKATEIIEEILQERIFPENIIEIRNRINQLALETNFEREYRLVLVNILTNNIEPNMILDLDATEQRQQEALREVEPVKRTILKGENIIRKGDIVTRDDIQVLEALGLRKPKINYVNLLGVLVTLTVLLFLLGYYIKYYEKEIWNNLNLIILIETLIILILLLAKIISIFQPIYIVYLVPAATVSILITVLINTQIALVVTTFISLLIAMIFGNLFIAAAVVFVGGLVGIINASKVNQRTDLIKAGFNVSITLVIFVAGVTLIDLTNNWTELLWSTSMAILNGVFVAILANGLLPYLENIFDLTSSVKLLELSNPSHPLLKRLLVEAPGTYHHSIIVGNLAENAADKIGANSLLTRVGAYFHDIGKLKRPYFFSDNQFGGDNPHSKTSPNLSALIIKSHVKDGIDFANKYNLPKVIKDIIIQHQGTGLISFFYKQAVEESKHGNIKESDFRYDGPKPKSKEAAIIMLADTVEAAVRSKNFSKNNHNRIELFVKELIREKLNDGQLDESALTLHELDLIAESFVQILTGIYHQRIEYPDNLIKEIKKDDKNDKNGNK